MAQDKTIKILIGKQEKEYKVIDEPYPHILMRTYKELHGWYKGKRECTAERLLINPYNGCSINCIFCYAKGFPGNFKLFLKKGIVVVCDYFDKIVARQLDSINVAACGYLSPVCDPFQAVEKKYHLSEAIIREFTKRGLPVDVVTKCVIPEEVISLLKENKHSFAQISILTPIEELRKILVPGIESATTTQLLNNISTLAENNIYVVARIDPILPYITDKKEHLRKLIKMIKDAGANHLVVSCLDIPSSIYEHIMYNIYINFSSSIIYEYKRLYTEVIDGYYHAHINYRKKLFSFLREQADKVNLSFALCMEYELIDGVPVGLNRYYMSSTNCEGIDIPIYIRQAEDDKFYPAADCSGACLSCKEAKCKIEELALAKDNRRKKDLKLSDYKRFSKQLSILSSYA